MLDAEQVVAERVRLGLEPPCPLQVRRERVVAAMSELLWEGRDEAAVKAIVSSSETGWRRAQAWYRQAHHLPPESPLTPAPRGSEVARAEVLSRRLAGSGILGTGRPVRLILNGPDGPRALYEDDLRPVE
jgi:hypothetical protein